MTVTPEHYAHAFDDRIAALIPEARLEVIDGAAHLVNVERPEAMNAAIQQHLRR